MLSFYRTPFLLPLLYPQLTWRIETPNKELYLTFDDGPVAGPTDFVLETLNKTKIPGTFFCIGDNVRKFPEVFKKIRDAGHATGNHTFNHLSGWKTSPADYLQNTKQCLEIMQAVSPHPDVRLFRPPYGRITRRQIKALNGYRIIMWDVLTHDYARQSADACLKGSMSATRPGSIVVFHDSHKAEKNMMYVLPRLVDHFGSQGFTFKSLS